MVPHHQARSLIAEELCLQRSNEPQQATPMQGGTLCVHPPLLRTPVQNSGGNAPPNDCSGVIALDLNAFIASGEDPLLVPGIAVDGQFWSRDPGFAPPENTSLSDAIHFGICP